MLLSRATSRIINRDFPIEAQATEYTIVAKVNVAPKILLYAVSGARATDLDTGSC